LSFYLDTSALVAATTNEAKTNAVQQWLNGKTAQDLAISDWVVTEYSSALSIKLREKQIDVANRGRASALFASLCAGSLSILPVLGTHFRAAAHFADQYALGLRSGDALHLAVAADHGFTLCTLDKRQYSAGPALGVRTLLL
jgi:predicted nucleic acid-binding protein